MVENITFKNDFWDSLPVGIYRTDADGNILYANNKLSSIIGFKNISDLLGHKSTDFFANPDDRVTKYLLDNSIDEIITEFQLKKSDGTVIWVKDICRKILNDNKIYFEGSLEDISSLKLNELNNMIHLKESHERYLSLYNNANEAIFIHDFDGNFIDANPYTLNLLGYDINEFKKLKLSDVIATDIYDKAVLFIRELVETGFQNKPIEFKIKKKNQELIWIESISSLLNQDGKPTTIQSIARDITERKNSEIQMMNYREKLEWQNIELNKLLTALEQSVSSVIITDTKGIVEYTNPITEIITGYSRKELVGNNVNIINSDAPDKRIFEVLWETITAGYVWKGEFKNLAKDGRIFWEYATVAPVFNNLGEIINFISIAEDITIRKEYELKIKESEQKNSALLNAIPDLMLLFDKDTYIIDAHIPEISDFSFINQQLIGKNILDIDNAEFVKLTSENLNKVLNNDITITFSFESNNDNIKNYYETRMVKCGDNKVLTIVRNITQLKIDEIKLNQQTKINEVLFKWASLFINLPLDKVDEQINLVLSNFGEVVDVDRAYIFKYDFHHSLAYNTHEWCKEDIESAIDKFPVVPFDYMMDWVNIHKNGEPVLIKNTLLLDENDMLRQILEPQGTLSALSIPIFSKGNCYGFVGFDSVKNIKIWTDEEIMVLFFLANLIYNLQDRVRTHEELLIAKNKAEESDKLKSAFLANMTHEIRTPMNGIIGFSRLLMSNSLNEEEKSEYSQIIKISSNRLIELINNILDISKIESNQMDVFNSLIDLNKMMKDIFELFEYQATFKNLELNLELPDSDNHFSLVTDHIKLHQILVNLIDNAIKFTDNGFVTFGFCIVENSVLFYVKDSGIGISESYMPYLFERFSQENLEYSRSYEGSGLGLAIVKGLADLIGAEIKVETKKEFGTNFSLEIPIDLTNLKNITKMSQEHIMLLDWRESVILIAEDDEVNYKYIEKLLARVKGITAIRAKNGKDAVDFATNNQEINLVLMDVKMPVLDGYSATKQIKAVRPDLPIIAVTAFAMLHDKQNALDAGCDDYISKPFEADDILKIINKFLSK